MNNPEHIKHSGDKQVKSVLDLIKHVLTKRIGYKQVQPDLDIFHFNEKP